MFNDPLSDFIFPFFQQRIFQKNHPKLTVDEYKVSETDLPSSQKHKLRRENSQDDKDQATSHPTTVRQKSILSVLSYTLVNVIRFILLIRLFLIC